MKKWFMSLEPRIKGIVTIIVIAVIAVGTFLIIKSVRSYFRRKEEKKNPQEVVTDSKNELNVQLQNGESLSKPASEYIATANAIEKLLDGCETASSELNVIENIITVVKKTG